MGGRSINITDVLKVTVTGKPGVVKYWDLAAGRKTSMLVCDFMRIYDPTDVLIIKQIGIP